jgi:hypothetical protein
MDQDLAIHGDGLLPSSPIMTVAYSSFVRHQGIRLFIRDFGKICAVGFATFQLGASPPKRS